MSKILSVSANAAAKTTVKCRDIASALVFVIKDNSVNGLTPLEVDAIKVLTYIQNPKLGKRSTIHEQSRLIDLAELCTMDVESSIEETGNALIVETALGAGTFEPSLSIKQGVYKYDLTNDFKGYDFVNEDELTIELDGLPVGANVDIDIYALESNEVTTSPRVYEILTTDTNTNRKFGVGEAEAIAIERSNNLQSVELQFNSGHHVKMTVAELDEHLRNAFGSVINRRYTYPNGSATNDIKNVGERNFMIPLHGVTTVQVNTNGTPVRVILQK
ncbi:MAG: hypothetical protein JWO32_2969 [Bacteroidetes bacterium]|nr:hypothetical protein [Bacteroidota bacterium]